MAGPARDASHRGRPGDRLPARRRREHLLDVAAELLVAGAPVTMEGVAAAAGVSKALPYRHFPNAEALVRALHDRELGRLAARVTAAATVPGTPDDRLVAAVRAFFDVVEARGVLLGILGRRAGPDDRRGPRFVAGLLRDLHGLAPRRAEPAAEVVLGALLGAVHAWACGVAPRRRAEALAVAAALAVVRAG